MEGAASDDDRAPLVRIHSECLTGDALGSERCELVGDTAAHARVMLRKKLRNQP